LFKPTVFCMYRSIEYKAKGGYRKKTAAALFILKHPQQ
jgi:hypothetical protein